MFNKCTLSNLCRYIFSNGLDYFTFINNIVLVVCHNVVCRYIIGAATPYSVLIITIIQLQFSHLLSNLPSWVPSFPIIIVIDDIICCVTGADMVLEYIAAWDWSRRWLIKFCKGKIFAKSIYKSNLLLTFHCILHRQENEITENRWKIAEIIYISCQKVHFDLFWPCPATFGI